MKLNVPVLYIASTGRSGSTLLEMLLSASDHLWSMGEIYTLPWEMERNGVCGCGRKIDQCKFWAKVLDKKKNLARPESFVAKFREYHFGGPFFRPKHLLNIFLEMEWGTSGDLKIFCIENSILFNAVGQEARRLKGDIRYLIDASKDFYRLDWMTRCPDFNLRVIHIVRDLRAYVYSNIRDYNRGKLLTFLYALKMTVKYVVENSIIEYILRRMPEENVFFIRYEDLASSPDRIIEAVSRWLKIPPESLNLKSFRDRESHAIAGNKTRHLKTKIQIDTAWENGLQPAVKTIISMLGLPMLKKYNYK